jgi:8-oxo-dGTP diphosphatase
LLTVDVVIELSDRPIPALVLVRRRHPPAGWALPGGFVEIGESTADAARREALEETGLQVRLRALLGVYSEPGRDSRFHTCSVVYVGEAGGLPIGGDDAAEAAAVDPSKLPQPLAFDHARIIADYLRWRDAGQGQTAFAIPI